MLKDKISIISITSISSLGSDTDEVWKSYQHNRHLLTIQSINNTDTFVSELSKEALLEVENLKISNSKYKQLDYTVLLSILTSRKALNKTNWTEKDKIGVNIGSSRGATTLFEKFHTSFLENNKTNPLSSPTTTLGNISSWVAHDLQTNGPDISHSITCSTALHGLLNGIAWLSSGMSDKFIVGGSESPLTAFTISQMKALKIYASEKIDYPCQALNLDKTKNSMILGTAAASTCLEKGVKKDALAYIEGVGYATEPLEHNASLSANADCLQASMKMAIAGFKIDDIDIIISHTPGTIKGDEAEMNAIKSIFGSKTPSITNNKWKVGHTLATSGMLSLELAILMIQNQKFIDVPFINSQKPKKIKKILVNAVGFGGNAVSILISKPN